MRSRNIAVSLALAAVFAGPAPAFANGAFPDSFSIFAPPERPERIILGTNFGILISDDRGASWHWICEQAVASYVAMYQLGAAPDGAFYALTTNGVTSSRDSGCSWNVVTDADRGVRTDDFFPDPHDGARLLILGRAKTASRTFALFDARESATASAAISQRYTAPRGLRLETVEIAKSDPLVVYMTMTATGVPARSWILRSTNGGTDFEQIEQSAALGGRVPRIAAVDPADPQRIYFRVLRAAGDLGDGFGISTDGGRTITTPLFIAGPMSGFLRAADGSLFVLSAVGSFVSTDQGRTFSPWATAPHVRALAERDGVFYVAADNFADGFSVGRSSDRGQTWVPLLKFEDIRGPIGCEPTRAVCANPWADLKVFFGIETGTSTVPKPAPGKDGCNCDSTGAEYDLFGLALLGLVLVLRRRALFAALFLVSCSQESRFVPRAGGEDLSFAVAVDRVSGLRTRILSTHPLDAPLRETIDSSEQVVIVRVPVETALGFHCRVDRARLPETSLHEQTPVCGELGDLAPDGLSITQTLLGSSPLVLDDEDGATFVGDLDRLLDKLVLELHLLPPQEAEQSLQPFGASDALLPAGTVICGEDWTARGGEDGNHRNLTGAEWLDDDRILATSDRVIYTFARGSAFSDTHAQRFCQFDFEVEARLPDWHFRDIAILPSNDGLVHVLAAGDYRIGDAHGAILDLVLDTDGMRWVKTTTSVPRELLAIATDDSGAIVAVGKEGTIVSAVSAGGPWFVDSMTAFDLTGVTPTNDGDHAFLVAAEEAAVYRVVPSATGLNWERQSIDVNIRPDVTSVASTQAGAIEWATVLTGLRRRVDGEWKRVDVELPLSFAMCAQDIQCGRAFGTIDPDELTPYRNTVAFEITACNSVVSIEDNLRCGGAYAVPRVAGTIPEIRGLAARGDKLLVVGNYGVVFELAP